MRPRGWLWALLALVAWPGPQALAQAQVAPGAPPGRTPVDLELVLAVDVSRSMDAHEQALQRAGYVNAFRDAEVLRAIRSGPIGRIAVTYVEWAGAGLQHVVVPWMLVEDAASGDGVSRALEFAPYDARRRTSISDALLFSAALFQTSGFAGSRRVIDVSGDGPNNQGVAVALARDRVLDQGIVINGLPIMLNPRQPSGFFDVAELDLYYEDCVIGGFGAFIVTVTDPSEFVSAIRRKLILEIAGRVPRVIPAQASGPLAPTDCMIGERLWEMWLQGLE
ncbi:MAG: DUF1194 domain-containing protein [Thalassobaculum sp.]|uniref:DUF1194 domain-containing protein n=1 Tax=Thalassobaculum sp. TaxID=2022740 RepID=UPI0032ECE3BE